MNEKNGFPAWNNNPEIFEINRLPARTIFTGFSSARAAFDALAVIPGQPYAIGNSLAAGNSIAAGSTSLPASVAASDRFKSLNGQWQFSLAKRPADRPVDFYKPDFDASGWASIKVPAHWQLEGFDFPQYTNKRYPWEVREPIIPPFAPVEFNPVGSYRRTFTVPESWEGMETLVSFQGVEAAFYIWVNGTFVGYSEDSFTPAEYDISPFLIKGENLLAVEVYRWCDASWLEDQDFWRLSGIFRDVFLFARPAVHIRDFKSKTLLDEGFRNGKFEVEAEVRRAAIPNALRGSDATAGGYRLELELYEPGKTVPFAHAAADIEAREIATAGDAGASVKKELSIKVPSAQAWSAENPALYTAVLTLIDPAGATVESTAWRAGFRTFELRDGLMLINGKKIVFYGVNRHEFNMKTGRCVGAADMVSDVFEMKRSNINAVRTSHYPNALLWYDLCDYYGLYVIDETNLETHGTWQFGSMESGANALPGDKPEWTECVLDRARSMYFRDRNHSSILIWSLGNESWGGTNHERMHDFFRSVDPDRVVHYEGVFHYRAGERASDIESQMYTKAKDIEKYAIDWEKAKSEGRTMKPFILCEYSHAMGNSCGGLRHYADLFKKYDCLQGGFVWDWIDQAILTKTPSGIEYLAYGGDFGEVPNDGNFSGNGLLFADRKPTPKLMETAACYQQFDLELEGGSETAHVDAKGELVVKVRDRTLFTGLTGLVPVWELLANGRTAAKGVCKANSFASFECVGAREAAHHARKSGVELMLEIRLELAKDAPWAKAGHVVARNQFVLGNERCELAQGGTQPAPARGNAKKKPEVRRSGDGSITITCGESAADSATGVTEKTTLEFSPTGTLRSISKGGRKIGFASCRPDFWRAITDNDRGNGFMERLGVWKLASWWTILMPASCDVAETDEGATVTVHYPLPPQVAAETSLVWKISGDGRITLAQKLSAAKGRNIPEIPFIGIEAVLETEAGEVEWYGAGPTDNYIDRLEGAPIREYRMRLAESYVPYLKPQECGNRTGVRRLSVKTGTASLRFGNCTASERPVYGTSGVFEFSALPWGREEIEKARHTYELDKPVRTVLRLSASQMGVGGDDSWGAQTLPEYILSAERDYDWSIDIAID